MDPRTGRIEVIHTEEDRQDAIRRGLIPLTEEEHAKIATMTHKQRIDWAAERQALAHTHHGLHSGMTRNQRKAERRNRGKRRGR